MLLKNKKGMTLIELIIAFFISLILLGSIFLSLNSIHNSLRISEDLSEIQLYTNEMFSLIHNQIVYATKVGLFEDIKDVTPEYTNSLYCEKGKLKINNKVLYSGIRNDLETSMYVNIVANSGVRVELVLTQNGREVYQESQDIQISFIEWNFDEIESNGSNCVVIGYNTDEIYGYDINTVANELRRNMQNFAINWTMLTQEERKEKYNGIWYANNSTFRDEVRKDKYGGTWPELPKDKNGEYPLGIDSSTPMYVQVYIHTPSNVDNTNADIVVFATRTQGNNWYTSLIYDHEELQWYQKKRGGWSCNQPWSVIKAQIHSDDWQPVKI